MSERMDKLIDMRVRLRAAARADAHAREAAAAARAALKTTALEALDAGLGPTEVAAIADVHRSAVNQWRDQAKAGNAVTPPTTPS